MEGNAMSIYDDFSTPLTVSDLEEIAKTLRRWERRLIDKEGAWTQLAENISRIEVLRPDDSAVIGHIVLDDGWVGFRPNVNR